MEGSFHMMGKQLIKQEVCTKHVNCLSDQNYALMFGTFFPHITYYIYEQQLQDFSPPFYCL